MYMSYTTNPHMPKVRKEAVYLVCHCHWGVRKAARYMGVYPSTVSRWVKKDISGGYLLIPTLSSKPHHHPLALSDEMVIKVLEYRKRYRRCARVLQYLLAQDGYIVSLSSISRILRRYNCVGHTKWKKWHKYPPRPLAEKPGTLVEVDTIFDGEPKDRLYVYTMIDVFSRWGFAMPIERISTHASLGFVKEAQKTAPFGFNTLQSDHGSEFSRWFSIKAEHNGWAHRHSRVRTPSDNGHLERFNRTLQEECLHHVQRGLESWKKEIPEYLMWYNTKRPHMALNMLTPSEVLRRF